MAQTISISDLATDVAFRLNTPAFAAGEFVSDTQILRLLQQSLGRLSGILARCYGDGILTSAQTLTTVPGLDLVSLPQSFTTLQSLHLRIDGVSHELSRSDLGDRGGIATTWTADALPTYRIEGYALRVYPTPDAAYTLIATFTDVLAITALTDTIQGEPAWADYVVADVCARIRQREQKDAGEFVAERTLVETAIRDESVSRDRGGVVQVRDTYGALNAQPKRRQWGLR